ncbi:MAG: VanZ family protein [candidate division Zixibacteria bacterium]|nr:VanZ family protein [candidate division Zixibacteria bacterium]
MNNTKTIVYGYFPAVVYAALIVTLSSIPRLTAPDIGFRPSDKLLHFMEYFIFGILWMRVFKLSVKSGRIPIYLILIIYSVIFAGLDEFHQKFVPMRKMDFWDFVADITGILAAAGIFYLWKKWKTRH